MVVCEIGIMAKTTTCIGVKHCTATGHAIENAGAINTLYTTENSEWQRLPLQKGMLNQPPLANIMCCSIPPQNRRPADFIAVTKGSSCSGKREFLMK